MASLPDIPLTGAAIEDAPTAAAAQDLLAGAVPKVLPTGEVAARLRVLVTRLHRRLRAEAGDELSPTLIAALVSIERHGPLTLGRLAELERVTPPSITRVVATLERAGLVRRVVDDTDRRVSHVSVTRDGARLLTRSRRRKAAYLTRRLNALDAEDLARVRDALPVLERLLEGQR